MSEMTKVVALAILANDNGRKETAIPRFTDQVKRVARFSEVLASLDHNYTGKFDVKSASALADIRIRDAVLRTLYDLKQEGNLERLTNYRLTLETWASKTSGTSRLAILALWAGSYWLEGNDAPLEAVLETEDFGDYSLWQLLDIAKRHNVPSFVWENSLKETPINKCLQGAV